jgi:hypothetical protein
MGVPDDRFHILPVIEYFPLNSAVTVMFAFIVTVHCPVPEQLPPLHPVKTESEEEGAAVSVIDAPALNTSEQSFPQLIPEGVLVTVPFPIPDLATIRVNVLLEKVATTVWFAVTLLIVY